MQVSEIVKTFITVIVSAIASGVLTYLVTQFKVYKALKEGVLSLLRAEIIRWHDKYVKKKFCPIYAKDALEKAYSAYHALGGNGTITILYNEIMALPEEIQEE